MLLDSAPFVRSQTKLPMPTTKPSPRALYCYGFGLWKRGFVRAFLRDFAVPVRFLSGVSEARLRGLGAADVLVVWGRRDHAELRALCSERGIAIWRMEDGFLRSVGLGSDFHAPSSLVVDTRGIYFDPQQPSDLEHILETAEFSPDELSRAAALRSSIVARALSKYNFVGDGPALPRPVMGGRVILVPGQVEDDASIACGAVDVRTNLQLLEAVRAAAPEAYVIYKPHPDVVSGNRRADGLTPERAAQLADAVITDVPLPACLDLANEVHTITSLVGFEALLRGKGVACYGRPFYCGWGLTQDRHGVSRRTRPLTLDMLVAGALIRYPRYLSQATWRLTTPEAVVDELTAALQRGPSAQVGRRKLMRKARKMVAGMRGIFGHGA
jgi:capsular polysaccharide export protein